MSRYSFNPNIDPDRNRNRRVLIGGIAAAVVLCAGVGLFAAGLSALSGGGLGAAPATPTAFKPKVTVYGDGTQIAATPAVGTAVSQQPTAAPAQTAAAKPTAAGQVTQTAKPTAAATANPAGAIAGLPDFVCPNPRKAGDKFGYGIQSNWPVGDIGFWNSVMSDKLKMNWTRAKVNWFEFEPEKGKIAPFQWQLFDAYVADANKKGLNIVATVTQPPQWTRKSQPKKAGDRPSPPEDVNEGIRFFKTVAARYAGCIQAVEVLNEPNLDREWVVSSGQLRAADYVEFLKQVVPPMRAVAPDTMIIMAAPSPTGANIPGAAQDDFSYVDDFVKAGGLNFVDCIGAHLNGYNMPPDKAWNEGYNDPSAKFRGPFDGPHHSWSFKSTVEGYHQRTNKPICVTEFGWASTENLKRKDGSALKGAPPGFDFALDNTEKEQADWIIKSFDMLRGYGWVKFASVFNLDFIQKIGESPDDPRGDPALYSIIRQDGSPRPAFEAIERMQKP